jgi:hypothetical protein
MPRFTPHLTGCNGTPLGLFGVPGEDEPMSGNREEDNRAVRTTVGGCELQQRSGMPLPGAPRVGAGTGQR